MIVMKHEWYIENMKQLQAGGIIYDMGCNGDDDKARLHTNLKKAFPKADIRGVDIKKGRHTYYVHDLDRPFPRSWPKADVIVAGSVLEHLKEPLAFLRRCHALLEKGGLLLMDTDAPFYYIFKQSVDDRILKREVKHYHIWDKETLIRLVQEAGFNSVEAESGLIYYGLSEKSVFSGLFPTEYALGLISERLRPNIYLKAKK